MCIGCIYRAYLPSGMSYIGQTVDFQKRKKEHLYTGNKPQGAFHLAIKIFGKESVSWEILEECEEELLNDREIYWIAYYDSFENGFNNDRGGRYDLNQRGRVASEETRQKQSISHKGIEPWNKGKHYKISDEGRANMRIARLEYWAKKKAKMQSDK